MKFKFEKLTIWQKAIDLGGEFNKMTDNFPEKEIYNLSTQMMRTINSIALKISKSSIDQSNPEFKKILGYAIRSLAEVITCLRIAFRRDYISEGVFSDHYKNAFDLMNMMVAFKKNVI